MKIKAKLYGTFPGHQHSEVIEVEIPERATVKDFLAFLKITAFERAVVIREGHILKLDDILQENISVTVFEALHGG